MPRKLIQDSFRGWYGWEDRFNSILRMSTNAMAATNQKNDRIRYDHKRAMGHLQTEEGRCQQRSQEELHRTKTELMEMLAYKKAYAELSFSRKDFDASDAKRKSNFQRGVKKRHALPGTRTSTKAKDPHMFLAEEPNGDETFPAAKGNCEESSTTSENSENIAEVLDYDVQSSCVPGEISQVAEEENNCCASALQVHAENDKEESGASNLHLRLPLIKQHAHSNESRNTQVSIPHKEDSNEENETKQSERNFLEGKNLLGALRWKSKTFPGKNLKEQSSVALTKDSHPRKSKKPSKSVSKVFASKCRSIFALRRLTDDKADYFKKAMSPENVRKDKVKILLQNARFPELIRREKTTSAIFRDFSKYKNSHHRHDEDQPVARLPPARIRPITFQTDPKTTVSGLPLALLPLARTKTMV